METNSERIPFCSSLKEAVSLACGGEAAVEKKQTVHGGDANDAYELFLSDGKRLYQLDIRSHQLYKRDLNGNNPVWEKLLLRLRKDKIDIEGILTGSSDTSVFASKADVKSTTFAEVVEALTSMGASDSEAFKAAKAVPEADKLSVDEFLKQALKLEKK